MLDHRAQTQRDDIAFNFLTEKSTVSLTYEELRVRAQLIATELLKMKIQPGDRVILMYEPGLELIAAFFGCLTAGVIAVLVYPPLNEATAKKLELIIQDAKPKLILTETSIKKQIIKLRLLSLMIKTPLLKYAINKKFKKIVANNAWDAEKLKLCNTNKIKKNYFRKVEFPTIDKTNIAFLQYTSGSTGDPKGVIVTHANLIDNLKRISTGTQIDDKSIRPIGASWLPPYHDMGLIGGILVPIHDGYTVYLMSPMTFLHNPYFWLKTISDNKVTVTLGPTFAFEYCIKKITPEQKASLDLSSLKTFLNGAEPIQSETLHRFAAAFAVSKFHINALYPSYGLAEATLYVCGYHYQAKNSLDLNADELLKHKIKYATKGDKHKILVGCGTINNEIAIVNPKTHLPCASDEVGEIWISSASVANGYWNNPELSKKIFQAKIKNNTTANYLRTGDLGFVHANSLYITGRLKDLVIIRGKNYYAHDIEHTVDQAHEELRTGCSVAFSIMADNKEKLVIIAELKNVTTNHEDLHASIIKAVSAEHQLKLHALIIVHPKSLSKTTSGKVRRNSAKEAYLKGQLNIISSWQATSHHQLPETNLS